jgi:D-arabinose 1-dehydrogenase-like Zn-dependent alcohol dehydrogenase
MDARSLPKTQHAVQLVGPGELRHNSAKVVPTPGPFQVLARVEAVGLCFSDLKLLKQFSQHARKSEIVEGISSEVLAEIPSYVPGGKPTVPGHEVVCRIVAAGEKVTRHRIGERCLVQTDYRALRTAASNAAFGYNFEGGLQEYVLLDERVAIDPESGERFLIPVDDDLCASTVALVEPWACVEDAYANPERQHIKPGGRLLVVVEAGHRIEGLADAVVANRPASVVTVGGHPQDLANITGAAGACERASDPTALPGNFFDDIVYFGAIRRTVEILNDKLDAGGIANIVTAGCKFGEPVSIGIGRVHYGMTRWIGTAGDRADESYRVIPANGEIRPGDRIAILGAAGPMGQMHMIRNICQGMAGISLAGADVDDNRLEALARKARPLAEAAGVAIHLVNTRMAPLAGRFSYYALLAPIGGLVADSIRNSLEGCIINIFAGIPASTRQELDLDTYFANRCFMIGTSGSVIRDMKIVLDKIKRGQLDTNCSVDAVSGMLGAMDGLAAVENRTLAGKIIVYPELHDLGLVPLTELAQRYPSVAEKLQRGQWTAAAEAELLRIAKSPPPRPAKCGEDP